MRDVAARRNASDPVYVQRDLNPETTSKRSNMSHVNGGSS